MNLVVYTWIVLAALGIYLAYRNGMEAYRDFQALGGKTNGRRTIAVGNLRREIVRGLIQLDFIAIGLLVLFDFRGVAAPGLILGAGGLVLNSYLDRRDRNYLMEHGMSARDDKGRFIKVETQNQREDRQFGEERRALEQEHLDNR